MSMIVPAGNKNVDWSPKETTLTKTASSDSEVQEQVEEDALLEAAKSVVEAAKEEKCVECECEPCECEKEAEAEGEVKEAMLMDDEEAVVEVEDAEGVVEDAVEDVVEDVAEEAEAQSVAEAVAEVEAKAEEADEKLEAVVEAVEAVEEAIEGVKEVCSGEEGEEVEVVEDAEEVEVPGEEEVDGDVIVEGEPEVEACGVISETNEEVEKTASGEEFCKFAKLTPENKKKLSKYWVDMLGYPKDYVNLLTKDYEK